jgi:hypothetical protein
MNVGLGWHFSRSTQLIFLVNQTLKKPCNKVLEATVQELH